MLDTYRLTICHGRDEDKVSQYIAMGRVVYLHKTLYCLVAHLSLIFSFLPNIEFYLAIEVLFDHKFEYLMSKIIPHIRTFLYW